MKTVCRLDVHKDSGFLLYSKHCRTQNSTQIRCIDQRTDDLARFAGERRRRRMLPGEQQHLRDDCMEGAGEYGTAAFGQSVLHKAVAWQKE